MLAVASDPELFNKFQLEMGLMKLRWVAYAIGAFLVGLLIGLQF